MTYHEALAYLDSLNKFGIRLGLERITRLLALMGNPERSFKTVHVTGTNGKGSTTAALAAMLHCAGVRAGMYTSPHLVDYTERIKINQTEITREQFAEAVGYTGQFVTRLVGEGCESPTQFEVLTAAAFYHFAVSKVEYAVIEVGLGGLLDSTNVIVPEVSIITNVALDHADRCGGSLQGVAEHKAGIIKPAVPVITAAEREILPVIRAKAELLQAPLYILGQEFTGSLESQNAEGQVITVRSEQYGQIGPARLSLAGRHQTANSSLAVMAALLLKQRDLRITVDAIERGLAGVVWPGRFEVIPGRPAIVIDGAHNPAGAKALRAALDDNFPGKPIVFLLGILQDKDIGGMLDKLIRPVDSVVVTAPESERAAQPETVAKLIRASRVELALSIEAGIDRVRNLAGGDGVACIAGSLYLIGCARAIINNRQTNFRQV